MALEGDKLRVNGNAVSWGSVIFKINGERIQGCVSITYGDKRERTRAAGMGKHHAPGRKSRGKYTTEPVKIKVFKSTGEAIRQHLADEAGTDSYGDTEFETVLQFVEADETPMLVEIHRCTYDGDNGSAEENPDPLYDEIEIGCMSIVRNGKTLFDTADGRP